MDDPQLSIDLPAMSAPPPPATAPVEAADDGPRQVRTPGKWLNVDLPWEKPPFAIPTMVSVREIPWNGYTVVSTFSGCGGSCLGYEFAGYRVLWASEFIPAAQDTYRANHPGVILDTRDIRKVTPEEILAAIRKRVGEIDVLEGSPPCASFSTAGRREDGWGQVRKYSDSEQRVDDLFFEFARILRGLQPKVFTAENVAGLRIGVARDVYEQILAALRACGYRVECRLLDAQWYGVPQTRRRLIFVGVREDLVDAAGKPIEPAFPDALPYRYSVRDALPHLAGVVTGGTSGFDKFKDGEIQQPIAPTVMADGIGGVAKHQHYVVGMDVNYASASQRGEGAGHVIERVVGTLTNESWQQSVRPADAPAPTITTAPTEKGGGFIELSLDDDGVATSDEESELRVEEELPDISRYAIGAEYDKLEPGQTSDRYFNLVKPHADQASPTITAVGGNPSAASVVHPTEKRKFTIDELKRICGFPDDFVLTGKFEQQWERLGRAVPPLMMRAVAETVRDKILAKVR